MLIVVEGCIGAGKSTVAKGLAAHRKTEFLSEAYDQNPFLERFYEDPAKFAIETELCFLLVHYHQLKLWAPKYKRSEVVSDFHISKDLIYADYNLGVTAARKVFQEMYEFLGKHIPSPQILVCLSASNELLLERIRKRKRDFELRIDPEYYRGLNSAYEKFFAQYSGPKVKINMEEWDFVANPKYYAKLSQLIDSTLDRR